MTRLTANPLTVDRGVAQRARPWEPARVDLWDRLCVRLGVVLLGVVVLLAAMVLLEAKAHWFMERSSWLGRTLTRNFRLTGEYTIPAWFNAGLLWTSGLALMGAGVMRSYLRLGRVLPWMLLGLVFMYLSADETMSWHELANEPGKQLIAGNEGLFSTQGILGYAWVIFGLAFAGIVGVACVPWLLKLPKATSLTMILAGMIYVGGAIGCEMLAALASGPIVADRGLAYFLFQNIEELLEKAGLVVFLHAITTYLLAVQRQAPPAPAP